jgi:hypothetical protein
LRVALERVRIRRFHFLQGARTHRHSRRHDNHGLHRVDRRFVVPQFRRLCNGTHLVRHGRQG